MTCAMRLRESPSVLGGAVLVMVVSVGLGAPKAWGVLGHRLVALIAADQLTPVDEAERRVAAFRFESHQTSRCGPTSTSLGNSQTGPWHYVNIPSARDGL